MRKRLCSVVFIIALLVCLMACQATPNAPIIIGKGDGALEQILHDTPVPAELASVPKEYTGSVTPIDPNVTITLNASVNAPDVDYVPVIQVKPLVLTDAMLVRYVDAFHNGRTVYMPQLSLTKVQISEKLQTLENQMTDEFLDSYYGSDEALKAECKADFQHEHDIYVKLYKNAPDDLVLTESPIAFGKRSDYMRTDSVALGITQKSDNDPFFCGETYAEDGYMELFSAGNLYSTQERHVFSYRRTKIIDEITLLPISAYENKDVKPTATCNDVNAQELAEKLLEELGLSEEFVVTEVKSVARETGAYGYRVTFKRCVGGIVAGELPPYDYSKSERPSYEPEMLTVYVDGDGVRDFDYSAMMTVAKTVNEGVSCFHSPMYLGVSARKVRSPIRQTGRCMKTMWQCRIIVTRMISRYVKYRLSFCALL